MPDLTKTLITQEIAQTIITDFFGSKKTITFMDELKEGYFNAAYQIKLNDGFQCVLKIAPPPNLPILRYEKNIMQAEVETLRMVKANTNMPVPEVIFFIENHPLLNSPFFCMDFIDGIPLHKFREKLDLKEQFEIDQSCGNYLKQMNRLQNNSFGCLAYPESSHLPWASVFEKLLRNVLQDGQDAGVILPLSDSVFTEQIHQHSDALNHVKIPSLVHWDLWDGNIFIDPKTKQVNGIIDFERALWADPLMEVNFGAFGINHAFLKGYGKEFPFTPPEQERRTLYNIYLFLIMVIECTFRQYPNHDQENWARMKLGEEIKKLNRQA
ncbi:MAG: aminoglycoside phosphotransferase family protein [Chloroflexota bacterium]